MPQSGRWRLSQKPGTRAADPPQSVRGVDDRLRFLDSLYQDPTHDVIFVDRDLERAAPCA
jgi:hypothetical protein